MIEGDKPGHELLGYQKIARIFESFGVSSFAELYQKFKEEDNRLFSNGLWNDLDQSLLINQIKNAVESVDQEFIDDNGREREWYKDILWLWYHHAISSALVRKDRMLARQYADKAVELQGDDPYNKITKLLQYLVYDNLDDARNYAQTITDEPEKTSAKELIQDYEQGNF